MAAQHNLPTKPTNRVLEIPAADPADAREHFAEKLRFETDPSDVWTDLQSGNPGFVLVDPRSPESFAREHIPGAINLHHRRIDAPSTRNLPKDKVIVVYCAGVHCNASTKGALKLAELGFRLKEMVHGLEGWKLEGYPVEGTGVPARLVAASTR